ncbi:MAG: deoxyribose-phosphate aldolase [Gaiellaceae bacterium]|nr:deoxyribose-phosphate aldolase [Gaiellaceae bacterium]
MKIDDVPVDAVGVANRVAWLAKRSIKTTAKAAGLRLALSMIDLTTLEGKDSEGKVRRLCAKALVPDPSDPSLPQCAAVCVYPPFVRLAKELTRGTDVRVASVATAFPSGQAPLATRLAEVIAAVDDGADEIDMVIDRGAFLSGHLDVVAHEIEQVKIACGDAHLKVILETGELETLDNVRHASLLAMRHGADFIKTSTGKIAPAATPAVILVMLEAIRDYVEETGRMVGMKPAGGIRDAKSALTTLVIVKETLGDEWLTPEWFRFGASSLANDLLMQLQKLRTGAYASPDSFSAS